MTQTSKEYAGALFTLALGDGNTEEVSAALDLVEKETDGNAGYLATLASPAIPRKERLDAVTAAFGDAVPATVLALLRMMISRGHIYLLKEVIRDYRELAREHRGESVVRITSAVPLTDGELSALLAKLEKTFSRKMVPECTVDPSLIGGIRVETEGRVMDGSIRSRLEQIKEVMDA